MGMMLPAAAVTAKGRMAKRGDGHREGVGSSAGAGGDGVQQNDWGQCCWDASGGGQSGGSEMLDGEYKVFRGNEHHENTLKGSASSIHTRQEMQ